MIFPEEVVVDVLVPTVRHLMVQQLLKRGLPEARIGELLGISQSAVSKYRAGKVKPHQGLLEDERVRSVSTRAAEGLAEGRPRMEVLGMLITLSRDLENRGPICRIHEEALPWLEGTGCNLCMAPAGSEVLEEQIVLEEMRRALTVLRGVPGFVDIVPNVGSNLAYALEGAVDLEKVAAVPGRIYEARGQVKVPGPPEFGASKHVAEVVLAISTLNSKIRSAINVAWNESILEACLKLDWRAFEMDASYEGRRERIFRGLRRQSPLPTVVFHRGDYGIEAITYILGETPMEVVSKMEALCRTLRSLSRR
ncbi:MAG: thiamine-phosphate synthase family protein [Thermoplasmata archaeon]